MYHNLMHLLLKCNTFLLSLPSEWLPDVPWWSSDVSSALTHHCRDAPDLTMNLPSTLPQGFVPHTNSPLFWNLLPGITFWFLLPKLPMTSSCQILSHIYIYWELLSKEKTHHCLLILTTAFLLQILFLVKAVHIPYPSAPVFCDTTWTIVLHSSVFAYKPSGQMKL